MNTPEESKVTKPILIIPPNEMSEEDIAKLNANGICTVVAKHPGAVKFLDPIPAVTGRSVAENAAIKLSRKLLNWSGFTLTGSMMGHDDICRVYVQCLVEGTELSVDLDRQQQLFDYTKDDEIRRLAREEAKAERKAKKAIQTPPDDKNAS